MLKSCRFPSQISVLPGYALEKLCVHPTDFCFRGTREAKIFKKYDWHTFPAWYVEGFAKYVTQATEGPYASKRDLNTAKFLTLS
jgi:hypothetical protein